MDSRWDGQRMDSRWTDKENVLYTDIVEFCSIIKKACVCRKMGRNQTFQL